jgi:hypothetical protein
MAVRCQDKELELLCGKRLVWVGELDELKIIKKKTTRYRVTFKNVVTLDTNKRFRDHVHILINRNEYDYLKSLSQGEKLKFSATIYSYYKKPRFVKENLYYRELSIGLKELKNLKYIEVQN